MGRTMKNIEPETEDLLKLAFDVKEFKKTETFGGSLFDFQLETKNGMVSVYFEDYGKFYHFYATPSDDVWTIISSGNQFKHFKNAVRKLKQQIAKWENS